MRLFRRCSLLGFLVLLAGLHTANAQFDAFRRESLSVSGKLMFHRNQPCDRCEVQLESYGMPVGSVFSDAVGNFAFTGLRAGVYTLKVELQGFETVEQRVEVSQYYGGMAILVLTPKPAAVGQSDNRHTVDLSTFMGQYPKEAVELFKKAEKNARKDKNAEAIEQLEKAIQIAPDFYHAHVSLGLLYKNEGRFADAETAFETAKRLNESSAEPLINLSGLYIDDGRPELAIELGQEAVKRDARSAPAFFNLGLALYRASRFLRAQEALQTALQLAPKMGQARLALANVFLRLQNLTGLREQLNLFLDENPKAEERASVEDMLRQLPPEPAEQ